jgi:hypothetical protein
MKEWLAKILQRVDTRLDNEGTETQWASQAVEAGRSCQMGQLDDQLEAKLVAHIKEGLSYQTCCDLVGLSRATFYNWIARGESEPQGRYGAFARAIAKAGAEACRALHTAVRRSDPKWILERRFPHDYPSPRLRAETELSRSVQLETPPKYTVKISIPEQEWGQWRELTAKYPIKKDGWMDFPIVDANGNPITPEEPGAAKANGNGHV